MNGVNPATGQDYPTNDIFLLRSAQSIPYETLPALYQGTGNNTGLNVSGDPYSAGPAFVAVLHGSLNQVAPDPANGTVTASGAISVERINYDSGVSALNVNAKGGNDYFAVDDNSAITTLDAGSGDATFQIGQIYGLQRTRPAAGIAPSDAVPGGGRADHSRLAEPGHEQAAGRPGRCQRHVHRLLQPRSDPARRRDWQQQLHGAGIRDRPGGQQRQTSSCRPGAPTPRPPAARRCR